MQGGGQTEAGKARGRKLAARAFRKNGAAGGLTAA
jgi:hypothetical protein